MTGALQLLTALLLLLVSAPALRAHVGNENNTEVRVFSDSMRVVLRTSVPFAWIVLGERAPAAADEAGQAIARPLLIEAAPGLIAVSAGGQPMVPESVDCVFEAQNDVAFVLNFKRPAVWPVVVEARFFPLLSSLDTGTIEVFDYTASRFSRNLEPVARQVVGPRNPSISFSLGDRPAPSKPETPAAAPVPAVVPPPEASPGKKVLAVSILVISTIGIGWLAWRSLSAR